MAVSPALVDYSVELKPYIVDAALVLAVLLVARTLSPPRFLDWRWWVLGAGGLLVILSSYAAPWALSLGGVVLGWRAWVERWPRERLMGMAVLGACLAAAFAILYVTLYSISSANQYLQEFWAGVFLRDARSLQFGIWMFGNALADPLPIPSEGIRMALLLPAFLLLVGAGLWRYGLAAIAPWVVCAALLALVSGLGLYPVSSRLVLFIAPLTLMVVASGLAALSRPQIPREVARAIILTSLVVVGTSWAWMEGRYVGLRTPPGDPAMQLVLHRQEGVPVYLGSASGPRYLFYATDWSRVDTLRVEWFIQALSWGGLGFRDARDAAGLGSSDSLPLTPPGHPGEMVAYASGAAHRPGETPAPGWAAAEVGRLLRTGSPRIMVFAGGHHRRELPALLAEAERRGLRWREEYRGVHGIVGYLEAR